MQAPRRKHLFGPQCTLRVQFQGACFLPHALSSVANSFPSRRGLFGASRSRVYTSPTSSFNFHSGVLCSAKLSMSAEVSARFCSSERSSYASHCSVNGSFSGIPNCARSALQLSSLAVIPGSIGLKRTLKMKLRGGEILPYKRMSFFIQAFFHAVAMSIIFLFIPTNAAS